MIKAEHIEFPLWTGEFGWEVMTWIPTIRKKSRAAERVIVHAPETTAALYADFATELIAEPDPPRGLDYPKIYRPDGEYKAYGLPRGDYDVLIHARGIRRKSNINYRRWRELSWLLDDYNIACVGTISDDLLSGCDDLRGFPIDLLCDYMAGTPVIVGASSGVMHLAALCGADMVVWGDDRTYFGETLKRRYKATWNPFGVQVGWITAQNWQPEPEEIANQIDGILA